jgi:hypothetical protein
MKRLVASILNWFGIALLRLASEIVPSPQRAEWRREWRSELWHVRQVCTPEYGVSWRGEREVAAFCLGAFHDAIFLRNDCGQAMISLSTAKNSATQYLMRMAVIAAVSCCMALLLPNVRAKLRWPIYRLPQNLVLIRTPQSQVLTPTISLEQFQKWRNRKQKLFDDFAFYRLGQETYENTSRKSTALNIVYASPNLFEMLRVPIRFAVSDPGAYGGIPRAVLSDATWKQTFGGDLDISGRLVRLGEQEVIVAGVAASDVWELPGKADVWVFVAANKSTANLPGFVVAHLNPSAARVDLGESWSLSAPKPDGSLDDFQSVSLRDQTVGPAETYFVAVLLALLALPATMPLALGEHLLSPRKLSWSTRWRRWCFLGGKIALLLPIVYLVSIDVAYVSTQLSRNAAEYLQIFCAFSICLFGLRWALRDQRQRCPVCLGKLTHPARVGQPSRNFLAWNGTELICVGGHGLMHVPELATSWFSTQRWMYLDASWDVLFDPQAVANGYF